MTTPPPPNHVSWRSLYARVRMETDKSQLAGLIHSVEAAMFARYSELTSSSDHEAERSEMKSASKNTCCGLRRKRWVGPGYPNWI
jgi:hypothetical protein